MIPDIAVKRRDLPIRKWSAATEVDPYGLLERAFPKPEIIQQEIVDRMTIQFLAQWRLPVEVLADDKVIAEYPATLWDHIKKVLGFDYIKRQVRLNAVLAFPEIPVPKGASYVSYSYADVAEPSWTTAL
jgi:hypothetical protein